MGAKATGKVGNRFAWLAMAVIGAGLLAPAAAANEPEADLSVTIEKVSQSPGVLDIIATVTNQGPATASGATFTHNIEAPVPPLSGQVFVVSGMNGSATGAGCPASGSPAKASNSVTCNVSLGSGGHAKLTSHLEFDPHLAPLVATLDPEAGFNTRTGVGLTGTYDCGERLIGLSATAVPGSQVDPNMINNHTEDSVSASDASAASGLLKGEVTQLVRGRPESTGSFQMAVGLESCPHQPLEWKAQIDADANRFTVGRDTFASIWVCDPAGAHCALEADNLPLSLTRDPPRR